MGEEHKPEQPPPPSASPVVVPQASFERERRRRKLAEKRLEDKSRELFASNEAFRDSQQQLIQSEKMATIGLLSAGIAHEINNPIGFIIANVKSLGDYVPGILQLLADYRSLLEAIDADNPLAALKAERLSQLEDSDIGYLEDEANDLVQESLEGLGRVAEIVSELRSFSRVDSDQETTNMADCIRSACKFAGTRRASGCDQELDIEPECLVEGVEGKLTQVLVNLLVNAYQAVGTPGTVWISCKRSGDEIVVTVADSGCGIPPDLLERVFEPFFTTKGAGEGAGLGLSACAEIIAEHDGSIDATSVEGGGTTITVRLPAAKTAPADPVST